MVPFDVATAWRASQNKAKSRSKRPTYSPSEEIQPESTQSST